MFDLGFRPRQQLFYEIGNVCLICGIKPMLGLKYVKDCIFRISNYGAFRLGLTLSLTKRLACDAVLTANKRYQVQTRENDISGMFVCLILVQVKLSI